MDLYDEFAAIIQALESSHLHYALCGGLAVAFHGYPRFTKDIDLMVRQEDLGIVKQTVAQLGFTLDAGPIPFDVGSPRERVVHRVSKIDKSEVLSLDLLVLPASLKTIWNTRELYEWEDRKVWIVSAAGLAQMKRLAGRRQDLLDLEKLGFAVDDEEPDEAVD